MPDDPRVQILWDRLANYGAAGGGTNLPPQVRGNTRILPPTGFRMVTSQAGLSSVAFTLAWTVPDDSYLANQIDTYNIYGSVDGGSPTLLGSGQSPMKVNVPYNWTPQLIVFYCQPVARNGFRPDLSLCPTCTSATQ